MLQQDPNAMNDKLKQQLDLLQQINDETFAVRKMDTQKVDPTTDSRVIASQQTPAALAKVNSSKANVSAAFNTRGDPYTDQ